MFNKAPTRALRVLHTAGALCALAFSPFFYTGCATLEIQYYDETLAPEIERELYAPPQSAGAQVLAQTGEQALTERLNGAANDGKPFADINRAELCERVFVAADEIPAKPPRTFRVAQLSDIHYRESSRARLERAVGLINASGADLVLFTGDLNTDTDASRQAAEILSLIVIDCPKIAVRGNWEISSRHGVLPKNFDFVKFFDGAGFKYLQNESFEIETEFGSVYIFGFDSCYADGPEYPPALVFPESVLTIIAAHEPARFNRADISGFASAAESFPPRLYTFCGHTHGGQITFFGKRIFNQRYSGGYLSGRYERLNAVLFVSKGLGQGKYNMRLFANYDILIADIPMGG